MSNANSVYSRIRRRETSSPRSTLAIILAVIVIVLCIYAVAEIVVQVSGQPPLLAAPADMAAAIANLTAYPAWIVVAAGIVAAVIGMILMITSLTAGRRPRHILESDRTVTLVDDEVIASALARHASYAGNVDPDNARVSVSPRRAVVRLVATSGTSIQTAPVNDTVAQQLDAYGLVPTITSKVIVDEQRKVGA